MEMTVMRITVVFAPWLNERIGIKESVIQVEAGTTLRQLFDLLVERHGKGFEDIDIAVGKHSGILVLLNNEIVMDMQRLLSDGDEISFAIPLSGG
ncbi:MAG: MoaD/ThiS family protein [Clostridium sp.]|jgi:molybdopterin converting factor small subunit|nr:MoaD/ThiS family protein [Clostridium sp.]